MPQSQSQARSDERAFSFLRFNQREPKPRKHGITEIRGPYYTPMGKRYLSDVLETMGAYVDVHKFAGGSFSLMPRGAVKELLDLCHQHNVLVSTGGFIERILTYGHDAVDQYVAECKDLGFDIIEISSGFITISTDDWLRLVENHVEGGVQVQVQVKVNLVSQPKRDCSAVGSGSSAGSVICVDVGPTNRKAFA